MKNIFLLISLFFIISCGSDDAVEPEQEMEEVIIPDDQEEEPDDENPADFSIPNVVVVGKSFDDNQSLFMIQWNQDYTIPTVTDIRAQIDIVNPTVLSSSGESFFIKENGNTPNVFKYNLNNNVPETYTYETYFVDNTDNTDVSIRDAKTTYLSGYFFDGNNTGFSESIYTYNITTGVSKTALLEDIDFDITKIFDSYVVSLGSEFSNSQETLLHIFSPETDQETLLSFNEYSAVIYNNLTNELFLFEGTGFVSEYDIFSLDSFTITESASLTTSIGLFGVFPDAYFYQDKMFYEGIEVSSAGGNQTPAVYDFSLGEKLVFDPFLMLSAISNADIPIEGIQGMNLDVATETLVVGFERDGVYGQNGSSGGVAFLSYDYEIKHIIDTENVQTENVILKD